MAVRKQGLVTSPALTPQSIIVPRTGMLATVRNRRGVVAAVEPFDGETGRLHLVHLEYKDERAPSEERILWEIEPDRHLLEPNALPTPTHDGGAMPAEDFDALLRARQRQGEVSALIEQSTLARLTREIEQLRERGRQGQLFDETERLAEIEQSIKQKQEELTRRRQHYEEIRDQLQRERTRILGHLLPARFAMAGSAQAFPVALEIRLPERRA